LKFAEKPQCTAEGEVPQAGFESDAQPFLFDMESGCAFALTQFGATLKMKGPNT